jgi:hypothetical protein
MAKCRLVLLLAITLLYNGIGLDHNIINSRTDSTGRKKLVLPAKVLIFLVLYPNHMLGCVQWPIVTDNFFYMYLYQQFRLVLW